MVSHNMQSDALWNMAIELGLASAPFSNLVVDPTLTICPPFDVDHKTDCLFIVLDNISSPLQIKTLPYVGLCLLQQSNIYKRASFHQEHQIDKALEAFFEAWKPV